jgi:hypothetical protein
MDESKLFEAAQTLAQSISQWALLIIGASLILIVSADYYRPQTRRMRTAYFLFIPAWGFLALSIYEGIEIQSRYVAYLRASYLKRADLITTISGEMNTSALAQIHYLEYALACLAAWLLIYIMWWIFSDSIPWEKK